MTRPRRILLELLGPPVVASALFCGVAALLLLEPKGLLLFPVVLLVAAPVAAIPAVLFTLVLELSFARGLDPGSVRAVRLAALLGLLAGCLVAPLFAGTPEKALEALEIFPALGAVTGALVGAFVRARTRGRGSPAAGFAAGPPTPDRVRAARPCDVIDE